MARKKRKSLIFTIMRMSVIPIAILGVVMTFYSQNSVHEGMVFEIEKSLSGIAHNLISIYNVLDAGDFSQKRTIGFIRGKQKLHRITAF